MAWGTYDQDLSPENKRGAVLFVFCKIVNKELDSGVVYEDDRVMAFGDIEAINGGHILLMF